MNYTQAKEKMTAIGQEHILRYFDELSPAQQENLLKQIEETDFSVLKRIDCGASDERGVFSPLAAMQLSEIEARRQEFYDVGAEAIKAGKTAALLLAGGMGTRLGSDNPKGMYDIGITKPVYIFERIVSNLLDVVKDTDTWIRLFIMTSEKNHDATVKFFKEQDYHFLCIPHSIW